MASTLQVFDFEERAVRIIMRDGEPWWVAKDICEILELTNPTEALKSLDDDEKMTLRNSEGHYNEKMTVENSDGHSGKRGGAQFYNIINESGLYMLITRSNKPEAKKFKKWVTSEVLPAIRQTGHYEIPKSQTHTSMVEAAKTLRRTVNKADCGLPAKEKRNINRKLISMLSGVDIGEVYTAEDLAAE